LNDNVSPRIGGFALRGLTPSRRQDGYGSFDWRRVDGKKLWSG